MDASQGDTRSQGVLAAHLVSGGGGISLEAPHDLQLCRTPILPGHCREDRERIRVVLLPATSLLAIVSRELSHCPGLRCVPLTHALRSSSMGMSEHTHTWN